MDRCNLLIIDDDPNILSLLNELLSGRQDLLLLSALSGQEAVEHFAANRVDVVLTDIHMPGFTGLELMADMKKINFKPEILVMTANATPESVETARRIGARSVILKPFDDLEILEGEINKAAAAARAARARAGGHGASHPAKAAAAPRPPAVIRLSETAPAAGPPLRAMKPATATPPPAGRSVPVSQGLPDFDAWNGGLTGNETPLAAPAAVASPRVSPPPPSVVPVAPAPAVSPRVSPPPAPAVPVAPAPAMSPRVPPAPTPRIAPIPAAAPQGLRPVHPAAAAAPAVPPAKPAAAVHHAPPARQASTVHHAPVAPHSPAPVTAAAPAAPATAPTAPVAAPAQVPAAPHPEAVRTVAHEAPFEEAVPEIPDDLESIFLTAARFDAGKMRMQVPIICLQTWEEKGAIAALRRLAASVQREFYVWSVGKGLVKENGQLMGDVYRDPGRALEFIRRHKSAGLYVLVDFRPCLEDKAVVRILREMAMELETARSMLVLTAARLPVPPELQPVCVAFDWPAGGQADPEALYTEVAEEVAAATGLGIDLPKAEREALLQRVKEMPAGRARFEIVRALMARAG